MESHKEHPIKEDPELQYIKRNLPAYHRACEGGEAYIRRGRLMTVGAAGDGKSCLIARLIGERFRDEHVITNALEAELMCKVNITYCNQTWAKHDKKPTDILEDEFLHGVREVLVNRPGGTVTPGMHSNITPSHVKDGTSSECAIEIDSDDDNLCTDSKDKIVVESDSDLESPTRKQMKYGEEDENSKRRLQKLHREELIQRSHGLSEKENDCTIRIWDFAGQLQYYILHHIFLRWRCVFILVINLARDLFSPIPSHQMQHHSRKPMMVYWEQIEF